MHEEVLFIIRCHPAETENSGNETNESFMEVYNEEAPFLPKNVIVIQPDSSITSYEVSNLCDAALMYGSTLSLEFSVANKPVIQVGRTNTTNKGFIYDSPTVELMYSNLDKAISGELQLTREQHLLALKYAYHWIYRRHIPEVLVSLSGMKFEKYNFNNEDVFLKGNNEMLDFICDKLESELPFIYDGAF